MLKKIFSYFQKPKETTEETFYKLLTFEQQIDRSMKFGYHSVNWAL